MADESVMEALGILAQTAQNIYATQAEVQIRQNESELDRKHETNKLYLTNSLNTLSRQIEERNMWKKEAAVLGLTDIDLTKVDTINQSSGSQNVIKTQLGTTVNNIEQTNAEINALANDVGNYYKGIGLGKLIDTDISGKLSTAQDSGGDGTSELEIWASSEASAPYRDLLENSNSFVLGLQNYTLGPDAQLALQVTQAQLKEQKVKNLFLPYKNQNELLKVQISTGKQELLNLAAEKERIDATTANIKTQTTLNDIEVNRNGIKLDDETFTYDQKVRDDAKLELGELKVMNLQAKGDIGQGLLSNMLLQVDDQEYVPFMAVLGSEQGAELGSEGETLEKLLEASHFSEIAADINVLINAYTMGMSTDGSWEPTIKVLKKIRETKDVLDQYIATSDVYKKMVLEEDFGDANMAKFYSEVEEWTDGPTAKKIIQAMQWEKTQIFKDNSLELFESLFDVEEQGYDINAMLEQIHMVETDFALQQHAKRQTTSGVTTNLDLKTVYPPKIPD